MKKIYLTLFCVLFIFFLKANTITSKPGKWNWNNSLAWENGLLPNKNDDVFISNGSVITLNINTGINSIRINGNEDSASALIIHGNISVKTTIAFLSNNTSILIDDAIPRKVFIGGDFTCPFGSSVLITNAEHVFEVQGNLNTSPDFQDSTGIVKLTGSGHNTFTNTGCKIFKMEIGDGINEKSFECAGPRYEVYFIQNGYLQVNRNATFYFNDHQYWNYHNVADISLNILNGAKVYTSGTVAAYGIDVIAYFTYFNKNIPEDSVKTGNLFLLSTSLNRIPYGTIGNITAESFSSGNMYLNINGTGIRALNILGNLNCNNYYCTFGTSIAKRRGDVTIHFKGTSKPVNSINLRNGGTLFFSNFSTYENPDKEYKLQISGNYEMHTTNSESNTQTAQISFYDLTLSDSASLHLLKNNQTDFKVEARGNLTMGKGSSIKLKALASEWFINSTRKTNAIYKGDGILQINKLNTEYSQCPGVNVTLKAVEIYSYAQGYTSINFSKLSWTQTAGKFYISHPSNNFNIQHYDTSNSLQFHDLQIEDSTNTYFYSTVNTTLEITGNLLLGNSVKIFTKDNLNTGKILFSGKTTQTINAGKGSSPLYFSNMEVSNSSGLTINCPITVQAPFYFDIPATLNLNYNSIINASGNNVLTLKATGIKQGQIINTGDNAFINGKLRVITKSTEQDSVFIIKNFTFPVGKIIGNKKIFAPIAATNITNHSEVLNNNPADDDYFTAEYFYNSPPNPAQLSNPLKGISAIEYWNLKRSKGSTMRSNIRLYWNNKLRSFIADKGSSYLKVSQFVSGKWQNYDNDYSLPSKSASNTDSITSAINFRSFSNITFGSTDLGVNSLGNMMKSVPLLSTVNYSSLSTYPNPVTTAVTVKFSVAGAFSLLLTDINGNIISTKKDIAISKTTETSIDLSSCKPGLYWIKIIDQNDTVQAKQIIKK